MGVFIIGPKQQAVQGFPINRSYTKAEADAKFSGGSGFTELTATGTVNGINTAFTFTQQPRYLVVDGIWLKATDNNGNTQWTWSVSTATLTVPPVREIYGVA